MTKKHSLLTFVFEKLTRQTANSFYILKESDLVAFRRVFQSLLIFALSVTFFSCASTSRIAKTQKNSIYPAWYPGSNEFSSSSDSFRAYGMAIAADSSGALDKAATQAVANLEQHISYALESTRSEAVTEPGSESGLDSPQFIFALRKAEAAVLDAASITQKTAKQNKEYDSYYGFAEVSISKKALINQLDKTLSANEQSWQALKRSKAFEKL